LNSTDPVTPLAISEIGATVKVNVKDSTNKNVSGETVNINDKATGALLVSGTTDATGNVTFGPGSPDTTIPYGSWQAVAGKGTPADVVVSNKNCTTSSCPTISLAIKNS
jgi:hypothetical protein